MNSEALRVLGLGIKVIVCDLDQTLLNSNKQISQANLDSIKAAQKKGIFVTICSGRIFTMLETYERDLCINGPLISSNGAAIVDSRDNKLLWSHPIDPQQALEIMNFSKAYDFDYSVLTDKTCYFSKNSVRIERFIQYNEFAAERGMDTIPLTYFEDGHSIVKGDILKMLVYELRPGDFEKAVKHLNGLDGVSFTSSDEGLLDITAADVDKGTGLAQLKRILGVNKEEVCVFGDYLNDLPMFAEAGLPIAMENAHDQVKANALAITGSNDMDGIAQAIYEYIL